MLPKSQRSVLTKRIAKATAQGSHELVFPKLTELNDEILRIRDTPPTIFHPEDSQSASYADIVADVLAKYRRTLSEDRRVLLDRYQLVDVAVKVVGIGSVGTLCMVALMQSIPSFLWSLLLIAAFGGGLAALCYSEFAAFLPVPMAFDVAIAYIAMTRGVPLPYVVTILCTLGIISVYSLSIVGKSISWRVAAAAYGTVAALGTVSGLIARAIA